MKAILGTMGGEIAAIIAFYGLEWLWLRQSLVNALALILPVLGCTVYSGHYSLTVGDRLFQFDPDCTYVDLALCSLPFLWRIRRPIITNVAVLTAFAGAVMLGNLIRVALGIYAVSHGASTFWAHDIPDYILWYPSLIVVAVSWLRSLPWANRNNNLVPVELRKGPQIGKMDASLLERKSA